jgi:hypothetical protein
LWRAVAGKSGHVRGWAAALLIASISGCILIPTPPVGINEIPGERLKLVQPGKTTRVDVLMAYGNPDERHSDDRVFIYRWDRLRAVGGIGGPVAAPIAISDHFAFAIEFDAEGRVVRSGEVSAFSEADFRKEIDEWLHNGGVKR